MEDKELIEMGISEELAKKISKRIKNDYIAKTEYKNLETRTKELEKASENFETVRKSIEDYKSQISGYETQIEEIKRNSAVDLKLSEARVKNIKAVKALLDLNNDDIDGQIQKIRESDGYLFDTVQEPVKREISGITEVQTDDNVVKEKPLEKMTYSEMLQYLEAHPDAKL